ncbi:TonB-dependent receptor domain-containing protein [Rubrivirga sp. IMCC43871]|uniref:TonB-dependent receptor domain-containing protein n=1 Tax=Rubrivirga sp. IMCC43871 TaxID=3391575 RepID=UPI00398FB519
MRSLLLAALALVAGAATAQTDYAIEGRVVDAESGAPVEAATVAVWRVSARAGVEPYLETGGATDARGAFRVAGLARGRYYVVASFVGTAPARTDTLRLAPDSPVADVGELVLVADAEALANVDVLAERDRVQIQVDRTVYRISDDPLLSGASTSEALETIPSVEIDVDGNVALRGNGNVVVLIDGRPAPVGRDFIGVYLQSLPANAVESVEVVPNPSAAYRPDGSAGILNIVLKKDTELGVGGALAAGGDTQGGYNGSALVTLGRGAWRLAATAGVRAGSRDTDGDRFRINRFLGEDATEITQLTESANERSSALLNLSADWAMTPQTTVTASASGSLRDGAETDRTATLEALGGSTLSDVLRLGDGASDGSSASLRLGLRHDFEGVSSEAESGGGGRRGGRGGGGRGGRGRDGGSRVALGTHGLSVDVRATTSANTDLTTFTEGGLVDQQTESDGTDNGLSIQADYARPLGETRLELGLRSEIDSADDDFRVSSLVDGVLAPDPGLTNAYTLDEQVHAAYLQLARQVGPVAVQAGLRGEIASRSFILGGEAFEVDYQSLFPSASVALDLAEATVLRASYSRRIDRPRGRELNPFPSADDPLNIRVGNPNLRPEYTDAIEVGVVRQTDWGSLTVTPYLRHTTDVVRRFQSVDEFGVTTSSFRNLDSATSTGVESVIAYQADGSVRGFLSLEGYRRSTDGANVETGLASDAFGWGGRLNANWAVGDRLGIGALDLQSTVFYTAPQDTEQGRIGSRVFFDVGLRQRLWDGRGSLSLRARDPFGWAGIDFVQDDARLYQTVSRSFGRSQVGLTLTYAFGRTDDTAQRQRPGAVDEGDAGGGLDF